MDQGQSVCGVAVTSPSTKQAGSPLGQNGSVRIFAASKTPGRRKEKLDRFIPNRSGLDLDNAHFSLTKENSGSNEGSGDATPTKEDYKQLLAASLGVGEQARILAFKHKAPAPPEGYDNNLAGLYTSNLGQAPSRKASRHIPQTQERILDAPDMVDDYYLNLLDWSRKDVIAVALSNTVYLWNAATGTVEELCSCENEGDYVTSLQWADSCHLAVGTSDAKVQIWDPARAKKVRELAGHSNRVAALAWNNSILSSGGRDSVICNWDVRQRREQACVAKLRCHEQEVCGLKWSPSGTQLASGGNDNLLCIWDASFRLQHRLTAHMSAVKAMAWCPFQSNLLASGGGSNDRCMRFWNTATGAPLSSIDTGSQVTALVWSKHDREILSSHGFSRCQLCLWKYPTLAKMAELTGHTARVLHMAASPDGGSVVTAGADETMRFWKVFGEPKGPKGEKMAAAMASSSTSGAMMRRAGIR